MINNKIVKGTLVLTITGIATKLLGFYNRIFLVRIIGVKEIGIYQLIFPLYILAFSFGCSGFSTALTKHVSYYNGKNNNKAIKSITRLSLALSLFLCVIISLTIINLADLISEKFLHNSSCSEILKIIMLAIPAISIKANINAYFVGIGKPIFQGLTNFFEQIIRILTGVFLAFYIFKKERLALLAVIAVIVGEITATIFSISTYIIHVIKQKNVLIYNTDETQKPDYKGFFHDVWPITSNNVILTLFSSFETIIIPSMLFLFYMDNEKAMSIYGQITGIVIPFILFPATITTALSTMLLPAISFESAKNNNKAVISEIKKSLIFCTLLGVLSWGFYYCFGVFISKIAFNDIYSGYLLKRISFLCPLIYISGNMTAILNGINKASINLIINIIALLIRISITIIFVPKYGVAAYVAGMTLSYIFLNIVSISICKKSFNTIPNHMESADKHNNLTN